MAFADLDPVKQAWLRMRGLEDKPGLVYCDMDEATVTFENGDVRQVVEVWTRVMGYCRPTFAFNRGKQQEHRDRKFFRLGNESTCNGSCEL